MLQFKVFHGSPAGQLETEINEWLARLQPDVRIMQQSVQPSGVATVSFLYHEGFFVTDARLTEEAQDIVEQALRAEPLIQPRRLDQSYMSPGRDVTDNQSDKSWTLLP